MKLRVFHNNAGVIISVVQINPKAKTRPTSPGLSYVDVDQKETTAKSLAEVHSGFRVDSDGRLQPRPKRD